MHREGLKKQIENCHKQGKKVAVHFCSHVPQEVLEAAGFCAVRLPHVEEFTDVYPAILPKNVCPIVRSCCAVCEDSSMDDVDLLITESTCDGKKKMYELLSNQERLYYYQVVQGVERDYAKPLLKSEIRHLIKMLEERFGAIVTEDKLRQACKLLNAERQSLMELFEIQKACPAPVSGLEIYEAFERNREIFDREARIEANRKTKEALLAKASEAKHQGARILITGCPLESVYKKVLRAVEENGGVAVCFENCEAVKTGVRHVDTEAEDLIDALADCYLNTSCAIMEQNRLRFELLERLVGEYQVDGVIDVSLTTCHAYSSEKFKVQRFVENLGIAYLPVETGDADTDAGQLTTRITAFIEMI